MLVRLHYSTVCSLTGNIYFKSNTQVKAEVRKPTWIFFETLVSARDDSPQPLQTFHHVSLDVFVFLVALQQRDGVVVVLAVDLVHLFQLSF